MQKNTKLAVNLERRQRIAHLRWSPRGHVLKSLGLASNPTRPQKCPVLGSKTALFFDWLKGK